MRKNSASVDKSIWRWVLARLAGGTRVRPRVPPRLPEIWGHRGAKAHAPENTLPAFRMALEFGACGVELDVHLAKCHTPVVVHDFRVDRTMKGQGEIAELDASSLAALRPSEAMPKVHPAARSGLHEGIPTLAEVMGSLPAGTRLNVELKGPTSRDLGLEQRVLRCIEPHLGRLEIWVSSFHPAQLWLCRQWMPHVRLGMLVEGRQNLWLRSGIAALAIRPEAIHPPAGFVDAELVELAHRAGLRVHVWGLKDGGDVQRLAKLRVDAILVDDVPQAVRLLGADIENR